jgi:hypothetical protein
MDLPKSAIDAMNVMFEAERDLEYAYQCGNEEAIKAASTTLGKAHLEWNEAMEESMRSKLKADLNAAVSEYAPDLAKASVEDFSCKLLEQVVEFCSPKCALCNKPEHKHGVGYDRFGVPKPSYMKHRFTTEEELADWDRLNNESPQSEKD